MKFSEPNKQSKKVINAINEATKAIGYEADQFFDEINNSLEKTNTIRKLTQPLKMKIHELELKKIKYEAENKQTDDIVNEIKAMEYQIIQIEEMGS